MDRSSTDHNLDDGPKPGDLTLSAVYQWVRAERLLVLSPAEAAWVRLGGKL